MAQNGKTTQEYMKELHEAWEELKQVVLETIQLDTKKVISNIRKYFK